jgi:hypothetical protein
MVSWTIVSRAPTDRRFVDLVTATCEGGHVTRAERAPPGCIPNFGKCDACILAARQERFRRNNATRTIRRRAERERLRAAGLLPPAPPKIDEATRAAIRAEREARKAAEREARRAAVLAERLAKAKRKRAEKEARQDARIAAEAKARAEAHERQIQARKLARKLAKLPPEVLKMLEVA